MVNATDRKSPPTERLLWIASECMGLSTFLSPAAATDERMTELVSAMQSFGPSGDRNSEIDLIPDLRLLDNHWIRWRRVLEHVSGAAVWLGPATKRSIEQFAQSLPSTLRRDQYEITFDCFSSRIPQWKHDLAHFAGAPNLKFLEIGSFEGYSAVWLLDQILTHDSSHLTCIDIFENEEAECLYDLNISRSSAPHRVTKLKGSSDDELIQLGKNNFDFIYVDGCHEQVNILQDAVLAWRLLKAGGVMTFDDYQLAEDPLFKLVFDEERPEVGIEAFLAVYQNRYRLIRSGYQVTIQKL